MVLSSMTRSPVAWALDRGVPRPGFIFVFGLISVSLCVGFLFGMGQGKSTPLSVTLDHWKEVRGRGFDLSVNVKKGPWQTFCSAEWPTFGVGWPAEGCFDLEIISQVFSRVFEARTGHPDQQPYILVWQDLAQRPPSWVRPFLPFKTLPPSNQSRVLVSQVRENPQGAPQKSPLPDSQTDLLLFDQPPPYPPSLPPAPSAPPVPPPALPVPDGPSHHTRSRQAQIPCSPDSTVACPLRPLGPPPPPLDDGTPGLPPPFSTGLSLPLIFITGKLITLLSPKIRPNSPLWLSLSCFLINPHGMIVSSSSRPSSRQRRGRGFSWRPERMSGAQMGARLNSPIL